MGVDRLESLFAGHRAAGTTAFLPFMTAGLPDPGSSPGIFEAMARAGADAFEVGIPYTDPLMDGPVIQQGSDRAIAAGTTLRVAIGIAADVVARTQKPSLAMTYANPVFHRGVDEFVGSLAAAGVDGLIVPDLPVEESASVRNACRRHGVGMVLFLAPTSDEHRVRAVVEAEPVFVYAVAEMGVTGERSEGGGHLAAIVERVRRYGDVPVVSGVGISTPEQAKAAAEVVDGVIVGSALVRRVLEAGDASAAAESVAEAVAAIASALH